MSQCNTSSRAQYSELLAYFETNVDKVHEKMSIRDKTREEGTRGILLLPANVDLLLTRRSPLGLIDYERQSLAVHMFCLNYKSRLFDRDFDRFQLCRILQQFFVFVFVSKRNMRQRNVFVLPFVGHKRLGHQQVAGRQTNVYVSFGQFVSVCKISSKPTRKKNKTFKTIQLKHYHHHVITLRFT